CQLAGRAIFYRKQQVLEDLTRRLTAEYQQAAVQGFKQDAGGVRQLIHYLSADPSLRDADKLAFLDLVEELESIAPPAGSVPNPLADPLKKLAENLQSIQAVYREEVTRIFSQLATRGAGGGSREKWEAYVQYLRGTASREKILAEFSDLDS